MADTDQWKIRMDENTIIVRNCATFEEYSREINAELCDTCGGVPHTLFAFPQALDLIREIVNPANQTCAHYTITHNAACAAVVTVTFTASTQIKIGSSNVSHADKLIVDCQIITRDESTRLVAQLKMMLDEVVQPAISDLRAINCALSQRIMGLEAANIRLSARLDLNDAMQHTCRKYGAIPPQLWKFCEEVMRMEIRVLPMFPLTDDKKAREEEIAQVYVFPAMSNTTIWLSTCRAINIGHFMEQEPIIEVGASIAKERRHWNSLLWIRTIVRVFDCCDPLWSELFASIKSRRIIIAQSMLRSLAIFGTCRKFLAADALVRSVVISCSEQFALNSSDITGIWVALSKLISRPDMEEIILPIRIARMVPPSIVTRPIIKSATETIQAEREPLAWCTGSISSYLRDEPFFNNECVDLIPKNE